MSMTTVRCRLGILTGVIVIPIALLWAAGIS